MASTRNTEHAMTSLLVLTSSLSGAESVSNLIVEEAVQQLAVRHPGLRVVRRDLAAQAIPHLTRASAAGVRGQAQTAAELQTRALSDGLIAELRAADFIVIGAPMYNFSIPSTLRTWFDHVLRPGVTFSYSAAGPRGLVTGKQAIVVEARGGVYSEGPGVALDFQEPYLRQLLGFIGITDVHFVHAEKIGHGPDARAAAIAGAVAELAVLTATVAEPLAA
jgi:FMN-dependent NADH-azoreductase